MMQGYVHRFNDLEDYFIRHILEEHGEFLIDKFEEAIDEKGLIDTEVLMDSLNYHVQMRGADYLLQLSFVSYGRAIEVAYHKSKRLRKETSRQAFFKSDKFRKAKRKDTRWYSKIAYGTLNHLLYRMGSAYTEEMKQYLKNLMQEREKNGYVDSRKWDKYFKY